MTSDTPRFGEMNIGKVAADEFVRLPRPDALFAKRSERIADLATGHPAAGFLRLMAGIFEAQARAASTCSAPVPLPEEAMTRAAEYDMPPISPDIWQPTASYREAARAIATTLSREGLPTQTCTILDTLASAGDDHLDSLARAFLTDGVPPNWQGEALFTVAALQVEFAGVAAQVDKARLKPLDAAGLCPVCGSHPVAGVVVADEAHGRRYLACGLCSTSWHHVRVQCISCGVDKGVAYQELEGGDGSAKCEICDECRTYSKLFYQAKNMAVEALADDLATLSLDLLVQEAGWKRHAPNPFMLVM
jgi:FdhE protein